MISLERKKIIIELATSAKFIPWKCCNGFFYGKTGDLPKAREYYSKALTYSGHAGAQLNNYGAFLCRQGQYAEAEQYFLKATKDLKYDHTAGAYENAGLCALIVQM